MMKSKKVAVELAARIAFVDEGIVYFQVDILIDGQLEKSVTNDMVMLRKMLSKRFGGGRLSYVLSAELTRQVAILMDRANLDRAELAFKAKKSA